MAAAIQEAQQDTISYRKLYASENEVSGENEFLFFIKPELTMKSSGLKFDLILDVLLDQIEKYGLVLNDMRILGSQYLNMHNIIAQHYGVINAVSASPQEKLTDDAKAKFLSLTGKKISESGVMGSLEVLERIPGFTPLSLDYVWQNAKTEKLAGGTYLAKIVIDGEEVYIINGFHPRQLEHYSLPGRCIITMTLTGNLSWKEARTAFIGATNPKEAQPGSLRNMLLQNREKFGLHSVSSSWNGFHLSAGPVEGLVELMRYSSDYSTGSIRPFTDFNFGKMLAEAFSPATIESILRNASLEVEGKMISVFDLTEEKNSREASEILKMCWKA
jgi:hypothetical protein